MTLMISNPMYKDGFPNNDLFPTQDVKASNILMVKMDFCKLADFGLVRRLGLPPPNSHSKSVVAASDAVF